MSFLSGFVTGLSKSIDDQLKKDMERTQDRVDGMAQYRVTRRRAKLERQDKEKDELRDVLQNLASLVDGNIDKAAQIYKASGGTISSANEFYKTALRSKSTLGDKFDINKAVQFSTENAPSGMSMNQYLSNFVSGVSKLPFSKDEIPSTGLYTALFKPKLGEQVMKQVETTAPLPKEAEKFSVPAARIDYNQFLEAKDYEKKNQIDSKSDFEAQYLAFDIAAFYEEDLDKKKQLEQQAQNYLDKHIEAEKKKNAASKTNEPKRFFSKEGITTIIKNYKAQNIDKKFLGGTGIGETLTIAFSGNEAQTLQGYQNALKGLKTRFAPLNDEEFNNALKAEVATLKAQKKIYINKVKIDQNREAGEKLTQSKFHQVPSRNELIENVSKGNYKPGDVVQYKENNETKAVIVTASGFI